MAKSLFHIAYVARGLERLWREFWVDGSPSDEAKAAHRAGDLGKVEYIEAATLREAMARVREKYPGYSIMSDGSGRQGGR